MQINLEDQTLNIYNCNNAETKNVPVEQTKTWILQKSSEFFRIICNDIVVAIFDAETQSSCYQTIMGYNEDEFDISNADTGTDEIMVGQSTPMQRML